MGLFSSKREKTIAFILDNADTASDDILYDKVMYLINHIKYDDGPAQCVIGMCFYHGIGVEEDDYEAVRWFESAVNNEFPPAYAWLGNCYRNGIGVAKDKEQALELFEEGKNMGDDDCARFYREMVTNANRIETALRIGNTAAKILGTLAEVYQDYLFEDEDDDEDY